MSVVCGVAGVAGVCGAAGVAGVAGVLLAEMTAIVDVVVVELVAVAAVVAPVVVGPAVMAGFCSFALLKINICRVYKQLDLFETVNILTSLKNKLH